MVYVSGPTVETIAASDTSLPDPAAIGAATGGYTPPAPTPTYDTSLPDPAAIQAAQGGYTPPPSYPTALPDPAAIQAAQGGYTPPPPAPPPAPVPSNVGLINWGLPDPAAIQAAQGGYTPPPVTPQPAPAPAPAYNWQDTSLPDPTAIQVSQGGYSPPYNPLPDPTEIQTAQGGYTPPANLFANTNLPSPAAIAAAQGGVSNIDQMPGYAPIDPAVADKVMQQNNAGSWTGIFNSYLPQSWLNNIPNPAYFPLRTAIGGITSPAGIAGLVTGVDEGLVTADALGSGADALGQLGGAALRQGLGWGYGTEAANAAANSPLADIPVIGPAVPLAIGALAGGLAASAPGIGKGVFAGAEPIEPEGATPIGEGGGVEAPKAGSDEPGTGAPPPAEDVPPTPTPTVGPSGVHGYVAGAMNAILGGRLTSSDLGPAAYEGNGILPTNSGSEGLSLPQTVANVVKKVAHVGTPDDPVVTPLMMERDVGLRAASSQATRLRNMAMAVDNLFNHPKGGTPDEILVPATEVRLSTGENFTPGAERTTIQDVAARLPDYMSRLTQAQVDGITALGQEWEKYRALGNAMGRDIGVRPDVQPGGYYIPRGNPVEDGIPEPATTSNTRFSGNRKGPQGPEKQAVFPTMAAGRAAGFTYPSFADANYTAALHLGTAFVNQVADDTIEQLRAEGKISQAGEAALRDRMNPSTGLPAAFRIIGQKIEAPLNALHTTLDLAFSGRLLQAATIDPRAYGQAMWTTIKGIHNPAAFGDLLMGLQKTADALGEAGPREAVSDGLILHNVNPDIGKGVPLLNKVPGIRGLTTAFGTFSDSIRVLMAVHSYKLATDAGLDMTDAGVRRDLTSAINKVTGAGTHQVTGLNAFVAFPNWVTSQIQMALDAATKGNMEGAIARRAIASTVGLWIGATYAVNSLQGKPTTFQYGIPRMMIGDTTVTIPGKYSQLVLAMMNSGKDIAAGNYGDAAHEAFNLYRKNAAPAIGIATDFLKGSNVIGEKMSPRNIGDWARELAPFNASGIGQKGALSAGLSAAGLSSYEPYPPTQYQIRNALSEMISSGKKYVNLAPKERGIVTGMMGGPIPSTNPVVQQNRDSSATNKQMFATRQQANDQKLASGQENGQAWRDQYHLNLQFYLGQQDQLYRNSPPSVYTSDVDKANQAYSAEIKKATDAGGTVDWSAVDAWAAQNPTISNLVTHAAGITATVDQYHKDAAAISASGYFDINAQVWAQAQKEDPALQKYTSLQDLESAAVDQLAKQYETQYGINPTIAVERATTKVASAKMIQQIDTYTRAVKLQWVEKNPQLAMAAIKWGYIQNPTVEEQKALALVPGN